MPPTRIIFRLRWPDRSRLGRGPGDAAIFVVKCFIQSGAVQLQIGEAVQYP